MFEHQAARGLGVASIGIGLAEIAMPRRIERLMGIGDGTNTGVLRILGIREIMHGFDILSHRNPGPGVWSRVAGDALDGSLMGLAATKTRRPGGLLAAAAMVLPIIVADVLLGRRLGQA